MQSRVFGSILGNHPRLLFLAWIVVGANCFLRAQQPSCPTVDQTQNSHSCAYVSNSADGTVSVIDTNTQAVVATITLPLGFMNSTSTPSAVAVTPDNSIAYVLNDNLDATSHYTVFAIATSTNTVQSAIELKGFPNSIAITPDGRFVYITEGNVEAPTFVEVLDRTTGLLSTVTADATLLHDPTGIAISRDGKSAYVVDTCIPVGTNGIACLDIINTSTNQATRLVELPGGTFEPGAVALSPDGTTAYVTEAYSAGGVVSVVDIAALFINPIVMDTNGVSSSTPSTIAIVPDGTHSYVGFEQLASTSVPIYESSIFDFKAIPGAAAIALGTGSGPSAIAITPDGGFAYVADYGTNSTSVVNTATDNVVKTITVGTHPDGIAIQPNLPPTCSLSVLPLTGNAPLTVSAAATCTDPENDIATTTINWGDGTTTSAASGNHTYSAAGSFSVTASATDTAGGIGTSAPQTVTVQPHLPPICSISVVPTTGVAPLAVSATATCTDPENEALTVTINWGDGTTTSAATGNHTYSTGGTFSVTARATDTAGATGASAATTVTVTLPAPPACTAPTVQGSVTPLAVTVSVTCSGNSVNSTINWGDGSAVTTLPAGTSTQSHTYSGAGSFVISATAIDTFEQATTATVPLTLLPIPPATVGTFEGQQYQVSVGFPIPPQDVGDTVSFRCDTVTGPNGTQLASDAGISCTSNPPQIVLTGTTANVTILINTTAQVGDLLPPNVGRQAPLYAALLPLPGFAFLGFGLSAFDRKKRARLVALMLVGILVMISVSCGGGFTLPASLRANAKHTSPGQYTVTVVDFLPSGPSPTFVQTSLIVPLNVTGP